MWGAATHDRSQGVSLPLRQTTLVLSPSDNAKAAGTVHAFVAVDHCLLWTREMRSLLEQIEKTTGLSQDQVTVLFSHTHAAGLMGLERTECDGGDLIEPYLQTLADEIARSIQIAVTRMQTSTIVYGVGKCDLARNRDYLDPQTNSHVCGYNPHASADDTLVVARVQAETASQPLAILVNYACHPTTLAWENRLISPDYIGGLREVVERETQAPLFFIQGASGDVGPREGYVGDANVARRNGRQLGFAAISALETLPCPGTSFEYAGPVVSGATLGTWRWTPMNDARRAAAAIWSEQQPGLNLAYRADLPNKQALLAERQRWQDSEQLAIDENDRDTARDARAMAERMTRRLTRVELLPEGSHFPYQYQVWRIGDAVWIALNGEHYNVLQRDLRKQFPNTLLIIGTLANGSEVWYLPDHASFGKGLYQEDASILAQGSLEQLRDHIIDTVTLLLDKEGAVG
jgi:hypothetical protein